jgi:hypothetical protein
MTLKVRGSHRPWGLLARRRLHGLCLERGQTVRGAHPYPDGMNALALLALMVPASQPSQPYEAPFRWLSVGPLLSLSRREEDPTAWGAGLEASANVVMAKNSLDPIVVGAVGGFGQAQWMEGNHLRLCGGLQGNYLIFGLETGVAHETGTAVNRPTTSLHLSPFLGFGYGSLGLRFTLPFNEGRDASGRLPYGREIGLTLTLKKPFSPIL